MPNAVEGIPFLSINDQNFINEDIRKELREATVISRGTQIIKRTPFEIRRRRDDDKMNHAELQLRFSCVHGRYAAKTCDTQQNRKMLTSFFGDMRMLPGKLKSFNFLGTCAPNNSRKNKSIYDLYSATQYV